ncbi:PfkB family carbohydrate kinase [Microbacterium ureisolvens]|uniref:Bifunctional hydroxymethylpyrimidine kinase/phosphomethylpyrimidine kinase n=1 Tax=Microbacterium ureisolvens TaxID=2781186 RepID=A0ABS7I2H2_9MICO|nr:PfkB family carbohydrate kinase [Microbacterium ureisolvens]MBW9111862.1 bifunctional hydroxymethylpyrimidine kinase/phosphomethylpyrimidine kinase [Microbacterium ureisolvens]
MTRARVVAVLGDLMLDVFEHGTASRLSPEAPVVVLLNPKTTTVLGGAANTAANARSLGAEVRLGGFAGLDAHGDTLVSLIDDGGMVSSVARLPEIPTTVKRRFLAGTHQIMRLDVEAQELSDDAADRIVAAFGDVADADSVVLSDYAKGAVSASVAQTVIASARVHGRPVVVDSKRLDPSCFRGCAIIAPNHHEAAAMTRTTDPVRAAEIISEATESAVLVTLGAQGMLIHDDSGFERIPSHAIEVSDVTGAGDTVTAALAVALAEGATAREAARWANHAAAVAVAHAGTYAVPRSALRPISESEVGAAM